MKEILDIIVLLGFVYVLFIFLRGMNETQTQKNLDRINELEKKKEKLDD
jgi:hypothetical protein